MPISTRPGTCDSRVVCGPICSSSRWRSEEHTSELQSQSDLVCRLLLEKKKKTRAPAPSPQRRTPEPDQQPVSQRQYSVEPLRRHPLKKALRYLRPPVRLARVGSLYKI